MSIETKGKLWAKWDDCIVDVTSRGYVYSLALMMKKLQREAGKEMDDETTLEWIEYNIINFYIHDEEPYTPMIIDDYNHEVKDFVIYGELEL